MKLKVGSKIYTDGLDGEMIHLSAAKTVAHIKWGGSDCLQKIRFKELKRLVNKRIWSSE